MNVLILSCGTRNKIVEIFKKESNDIVIATDCSPLAPALYAAHKSYVVPRITDHNYVDEVLRICEKEKINAVFSLIDPELAILAEKSNQFRELGVTVIGSSKALCDLSLNKWEMYQWLKRNGFLCAKSYKSYDMFKEAFNDGEISFPVMIKPICGSASISITIANNLETVKNIMDNYSDMMIQEFLDGQEIGVDCYIDLLSKKLISVFAKKKLVMRAGETDKSVSFKDESLFAVVERFVTKAGYTGVIDIDVFEVDGQYYISEVNPRFGGGYPHAYACGVNFPELIRNNVEGRENTADIGNYNENLYMMKYNEICIKEGDMLCEKNNKYD